MKRTLRENKAIKDKLLLVHLKNEFGDITASFESMLLPFTLNAYREDILVRIQEDEVEQIQENYNEFIRNLKQLIQSTITFVNKYTSVDIILVNTNTNQNFTNFVSNKIGEALDLYDSTITTIKQDNQELYGLIQNAFFAYTMLARVLNTAIHYYNQRHPQNQLPELQNIPNPQYLEVGENISDFIRRFIRDMKELGDIKEV